MRVGDIGYRLLFVPVWAPSNLVHLQKREWSYRIGFNLG
jgi:hypothetical protein